MLLTYTRSGLYCGAGDFYIDPSRAVANAVITHAHSDHARPGSQLYYCVDVGYPLLRARLGASVPVKRVKYGEKFKLGSVILSLHPAGHILGSSQVRVESQQGEVWVVSGDYKRDPDPTCQPFEVVPCDTFITESTFGKPIYRWDPMSEVAQEILSWWEDNRNEGSASLLQCYSLGKAQRVLAELLRLTDQPVYIDDATWAITHLYIEAGIPMVPVRKLEAARGKTAGALIIAPPGARVSARLRDAGASFQVGFASGWMNVRAARKLRGMDRGFVISDHADWPSLLQTVRESGARRVYVMHGEEDMLARYLRERCGIEDSHDVSALSG